MAPLLIGGILLGGLAGLREEMELPGPLTQERRLVLPRGAGLSEVALDMEKGGVVTSWWLFMATVWWEGARQLKAGEYEFAAGVSALEAVRMLHSGRTLVRRLTIPEGLTVAAIVALVEAEEALSGEIKARPPEGALFPDTYHFSRGDDRQAILLRMQRSMTDTLANLWHRRASALPFARPEEALILASIIEKETAVPAERRRIAGVFINRLRRGMRLQSDPTVIYGLTLGQGALGRSLTRADWQRPSPFNTYVVEGLPPTPIASPGRAALEAVLDPEPTEALYFVADGAGGHVFATTLAEHNRNVARWLELRRSRGEVAATP